MNCDRAATGDPQGRASPIMNIRGKHHRTIWTNADGWSVVIIDQTQFPHVFTTTTLKTLGDAAHAIKTMMVRGAPLIGATAAYGVCLQMRDNPSDEGLEYACNILERTRPTAVNLKWALGEMRALLKDLPPKARAQAAYAKAAAICDDDVEINRAI